MFCRRKLNVIDSKLDDVIKLVTKSDEDKIPEIFHPIISIFFVVFTAWLVLFVNQSRHVSGWLNVGLAFMLYFLIVFTYRWITNLFLILIWDFLIFFSILCNHIALFFISPTRTLALIVNKIYSLNQQQQQKTKKNSNSSGKIKDSGKHYLRQNFIDSSFSILLFIIIFLLIRYGNENCLTISNWSWAIILYAIIFRTISRSFEIIIAFGKDCFETKNSGQVQPNNRQILAMSSLVENIFNYAVVYYLVGVPNYPCLWQSFVLSIKTNFFQTMELNTATFYPDQASLLMILQFLTSFTLIVFSIAMYASDNKRLQRDNGSGN